MLGSLPPALARLGEHVAVLLPLYRTVVLPPDHRRWGPMTLWVGPHSYAIAIEEIERAEVRTRSRGIVYR